MSRFFPSRLLARNTGTITAARSRAWLGVWAVATAVAIVLGAARFHQAPPLPPGVVDHELSKTPPLGWSDWNSFGCNITEQEVKDTADLFVSTGLKAAGYEYINIDDCWALPTRSITGHLRPNPATFPDGIKAIAQYVHAKGLKLGLYSSAGTVTCSGEQPGSLGHELTDARDFASWGVDYLKYDNCGSHGTYPDTRAGYQARFAAMTSALSMVRAQTGHAIYYSLCEWGTYQPWTWAATVGNSWRTTPDISDNYTSMLSNFQHNVVLSRYASAGAWNDPDMLEVGNGGMTQTEDKSHFALWAMMNAPLVIGTDLRNHITNGVKDSTYSILENTNLIALDQDPLGRQADLVSSSRGLYVLRKQLANGDIAIALFNSGPTTATMTISNNHVGLHAPHGLTVKDLWTGTSTPDQSSVTAKVAPHETKVYRISPTGH